MRPIIYDGFLKVDCGVVICLRFNGSDGLQLNTNRLIT